MPDENPKLFISYSWSNLDHEQWVLELATALRDNSVDVILDKWRLKEGQEANAFMEQMVTDPSIKKVAIICDRMYKEKADNRKEGVGTESQIITSELYKAADQTKFVAIVREKDADGKSYVPAFYTSRIYIDWSDDDDYATNFERLLRWIYDKPLYEEPPLGKKPAFLSEAPSVSLGTAIHYRRTKDAIKNGKSHALGSLQEYLTLFAENCSRFRIPEYKEPFDELVIEKIDQFRPFRNELIEILSLSSQYQTREEIGHIVHKFFENLLPLIFEDRKIPMTDNFKYSIHELFIYAIATFLKFERFETASYLLRQPYPFIGMASAYGQDMIHFSQICAGIDSMEKRNKRLSLNRISLRADMLLDGTKGTNFECRHIIQADILLFFRDCFDTLKMDKPRQSWMPFTAVLAHYHQRGLFDVFARSISAEYFDRFKIFLGISTKEEFLQLEEAFSKSKLRLPSFDILSFGMKNIFDFDKIATVP
ncbi:hypothetical protein EH223_05165 [candidate division KSB1 bacterium]|nr:MAG: hypothetical protein EH223_05165 [candidate division KSB1 bacterium]